MSSFCLLKTKFELRVYSSRVELRKLITNNIFGGKGFLVDSGEQNSGKVCSERILVEERKSFIALMST